MRTLRLSFRSAVFIAKPSASNSVTRRDIVGARTCSAAAKPFSVCGPPNTSTDSADDFGPDRPEAASVLRKRRNNLIAAA